MVGKGRGREQRDGGEKELQPEPDRQLGAKDEGVPEAHTLQSGSLLSSGSSD